MKAINLWLCDVASGQLQKKPLLDHPFLGVRLGVFNSEESVIGTYLNLRFREADMPLVVGEFASYETLVIAFQHAWEDAKNAIPEEGKTNPFTDWNVIIRKGFKFTAYANYGQYQYEDGYTIRIEIEGKTLSQYQAQWITRDNVNKADTLLILATDDESKGCTSGTVSDTKDKNDELEGLKPVQTGGGIDPDNPNELIPSGSGDDWNPNKQPALPGTGSGWQGGDFTDPDLEFGGSTSNGMGGSSNPDGLGEVKLGSGEFTSTLVIRELNALLGGCSSSLLSAHADLSPKTTTDPETGQPIVTPAQISADILADLLALAQTIQGFMATLSNIMNMIIDGAKALFEAYNTMMGMLQACAINRLLQIADLQIIKDLMEIIDSLESAFFLKAIREAVAEIVALINEVVALARAILEDPVRNAIAIVRRLFPIIDRIIKRMEALIGEIVAKIKALLAKLFNFFRGLGFISGFLNCARALLQAYTTASVALSKINPEAGKYLKLASETQKDLDSGVIPDTEKSFYPAQKLDEEMNVSGEMQDDAAFFKTALSDIHSWEKDSWEAEKQEAGVSTS